MRLAVSLILATLLALPPAAAVAQLRDENLIVTVPKGYKLGHQARNAQQQIAEWVPEGQTVENWSEMITHQIFFGLKTTPGEFKARMDRLWAQACPGTRKSAVITEDPENGYPALLWLMACETNPKTGKPEITWFKAVRGNDSFYVVQKAFKFMPGNDQTTPWINYLKGVSVCDTRLPDRPCPKMPPR